MSQDNACRTPLLAVAVLICLLPVVSAQTASRGTTPVSNGPGWTRVCPLIGAPSYFCNR